MRRLCIILAATLTIIAVHGQTHYEGNIAVGGKAGATLSRVRFNPSVPQTMLPGFMAGVAFRYMEEKHFGLIVELNMEQRGWKETFEGYDFHYQRRFTYLQLPVLEIGFMIGKNTKANFDYTRVWELQDFPTANRSIGQFDLPVEHKFDYGISAGVGMELIARNRSSFQLEGRFYYGLNDVFGNHKSDVFSASSSMSIMITLGYYYRIK